MAVASDYSWGCLSSGVSALKKAQNVDSLPRYNINYESKAVPEAYLILKCMWQSHANLPPPGESFGKELSLML